MSVSVDHSEAKKVLLKAFTNVKTATFEIESENTKLKDVILGSHLTFRYILINGLLAKATNSSVNPITLQVGSELDGAYDARSLCHGVLVKFEREHLDSVLGGSNEPFLNKPARYTELSTSNAVRRGNDERLRNYCIDILGNISTSDESYKLLEEALSYALQRESRNLASKLVSSDIDEQPNFISFVHDFLSVSCEGETPALVAGLTFELLGLSNGSSYDVKVHPTNQAGSSSNEIGDIDVREGGKIKFVAEVKDKDYSNEDVEHAAKKAASSGVAQILFLVGPQSSTTGMQSQTATWGDTKVKVTIIDLVHFFTSIYGLVENTSNAELVKIINQHAIKARVKDATLDHLKSCCVKYGLLE